MIRANAILIHASRDTVGPTRKNEFIFKRLCHSFKCVITAQLVVTADEMVISPVACCIASFRAGISIIFEDVTNATIEFMLYQVLCIRRIDHQLMMIGPDKIACLAGTQPFAVCQSDIFISCSRQSV
jgi:hypothetical protein